MYSNPYALCVACGLEYWRHSVAGDCPWRLEAQRTATADGASLGRSIYQSVPPADVELPVEDIILLGEVGSASLEAQLAALREAQLAALREALEFYADPETYHGSVTLFDPPGGGWESDFSDDHGHPDYQRPMPGKRARKALKSFPAAASAPVPPTDNG